MGMRTATGVVVSPRIGLTTKVVFNGITYVLIDYKGIRIAPKSLEKVLVRYCVPVSKEARKIDSSIDIYVDDVHMGLKPKELFEKIRRNEI